MAIITYPLLTVVDDAGSLVPLAEVTVVGVKSPLDEDVDTDTVTLRRSGANVAADYDAEANGEAWVTLSISNPGSTISGWNASPSFYMSKDPSWLRSLGTAAADDAVHVLAARPSGATHYRLESLNGGSRQWWNGSALVDTEPSATALPSDRADGLLAFDVTGLPAGEYAVAFYNGATGTAVGVPLGATVGGGAMVGGSLTLTIGPTQLAAIATAVLDAAFEGSMKFSDFLKLASAVLAGNSTNNGLYFKSPADGTKVRIQASVDGSGNRTVSQRDVS